MRSRRLIVTSLVCVLLAGGCTLVPSDEQVAGACGRALDRAAEVVDARARALDRTTAVTDVDPLQLEATVAHREAVQRAVLGPVARLTTTADQRAQEYRRLHNRCRRRSGELPPRCDDAFTQATRLARMYPGAIQTRIDFWSEGLRLAQGALAGDAPAIRKADARQGRLITEYTRQVTRIERGLAQRTLAYADCNQHL